MERNLKILSDVEKLSNTSMEELKGGHIVIIKNCNDFTMSSSQKLQ